jgi:hypothetical protein
LASLENDESKTNVAAKRISRPVHAIHQIRFLPSSTMLCVHCLRLRLVLETWKTNRTHKIMAASLKCFVDSSTIACSLFCFVYFPFHPQAAKALVAFLLSNKCAICLPARTIFNEHTPPFCPLPHQMYIDLGRCCLLDSS